MDRFRLRLPSFARTRPGDRRFVLLVPLTGFVSGLAAAVLVRLLAFVQKLFWGDGHHLLEAALALPWWHRLLAPIVGGLLVGLLILAARRPVGGHGTSSIIEAVAQRGGVLKVADLLRGSLGTLLT